jgi:hypothetical protein
MTRFQALHSFQAHAYYAALILKLKEKEFAELEDFCFQHSDLSHLDFEARVQRWKLNGLPSKRTKNHPVMCDLLIASNNQAQRSQK